VKHCQDSFVYLPNIKAMKHKWSGFDIHTFFDIYSLHT